MGLEEINEACASASGISIVPTIQNVVCTLNLGCKLDVKQIALQASNAEHSNNFSATATLRIREPKSTARIFASGKMVVTGAKNEAEAEIAAAKFARVVQNLWFRDVEFMDFKIQNIVASSDVKFPKVTILIFASGKVVITGAKCREDLCKALELIYPVLQQFHIYMPSLSAILVHTRLAL